MASDTPRYGPDELAELAGVSRRTVRYYVQRGLLPAPAGVGRGKHYDDAHLSRLKQIRAWQEAGEPLERIADRLDPQPVVPARPVAGEAWARVVLADGIELHVRHGRLSDTQLHVLVASVRNTLGGE